MNFESYSIKLKKNKNDSNLDSAQFSLSYKQHKTKADIKKQSYEIISALKGDNNLIIEMNSSLFSARVDKDSHVKKFVNSIRDLNLDYRYNKVPAKGSPSFLSKIFGGDDNEYAHEILAFVPHNIWSTEDFENIIPLCGIRYYITKRTALDIGGEELLNEMSRMMDSEKLNYFKFIIFDGGRLANMGINSDHLSINDIKQRLGLL